MGAGCSDVGEDKHERNHKLATKNDNNDNNDKQTDVKDKKPKENKVSEDSFKDMEEWPGIFSF